MATSDDEEDASTADTDDDTGQNSCIMCINPPKIVPFSAKTWNTFIKYVQKWKSLEGDQGEIAGQFIAEHQQFHFGNVVEGNAIPRPQHAGYHQVCYTRFTEGSRFIQKWKSKDALDEEISSAVFH